MSADPYLQFKAAQAKGWATFSPLATFTTPPAAALVAFAGVQSGNAVLDVACGTGVVALTAAQLGARVCGLDLSPGLLEHAHHNAAVLEAPVEFLEGDAEALPYADATFDVVLSQFGHMFAPRPELAVREMLRVLKPGGRLAFSTWPPQFMIGQMFDLVAAYLPGPPGAAAPSSWGDPAIVRERLVSAVHSIEFGSDEMTVPTLGPRQYRANMEITAAPVAKVIEQLAGDPARLTVFRAELEALTARYFRHNRVHQTFLMTRAIKL